MDARLLRLSLRLTQADLAARAHTSQTSISAFERSIRPVSPGLAQRILEALVAEGIGPTDARKTTTPAGVDLSKVGS